MINYVKPGEVMTYAVPAGGVVSGSGYLIGALFVVATTTVAFAAGATFEGVSEGVVNLTKLAGEGALDEGDPLWWDVANSRVTVDPSAGLPIGTVGTGGALTGDVTCNVRLYGDSFAGRMLTLRKRLAIGAINAAPVTIVPAYPGLKARMVSSKAIAIGGAAGAVTTVDILATQAAGSVKLVAFAQASLVQSAVLTAGGAGAAVLADGASYMQNDANTAIQVSKTGANITVATNIDFEFTYQLEA